MSATYSIVADPGRDFIRVHASGFFATDTVAALVTELELAHTRLRCGVNMHVTLADMSAMQIQPQEVVMAFAAIVADQRLRSRRLAVVVGHSLARGQIRRLTDPDREGLAYFHDVAAAEAWLFAEVPLSDARTTSLYRRVPVSPKLAAHGCIALSAG